MFNDATHISLFINIAKDAMYTGRNSGTKRTWNAAGKRRFNHYMEQVCIDRDANGKDFDKKLLKFVKKTYTKIKSADELQYQEMQKPQAVTTYNDASIRQILSQQNELQRPRKIPDAWDDDDDVGDWEEEDMHLI